jgi:penicillin amidase
VLNKRRIAALTICWSLATLAGYVYSRLKTSLPITAGELELDGLSTPVQVTFDKAGVPHIKAQTDVDAFMALGYVMAQDRLVQMDIMRRVATGRLGELIGPMAIDVDRFMRTLGIDRLAAGNLRNISDEHRLLFEAYLQGVNSYISQEKKRLPVEYMLFGGRPKPFTLEDIISIGIFVMWELDASWLVDLMREKLIRKLGMKISRKLLPEFSALCEPACTFEGDGCSAETLEPGEEIDWGIEKGAGGRWTKRRIRIPLMSGSNNWVVSGSKSVTGKPILCNDPHLEHMVPSVLYIYHLDSPGFKVVGAGLGGVPVVVIGHNEKCAWGMTSFVPDVVDLYVETFESETSNRYLYKGEWLEPDVTVDEVRFRFMGKRGLERVETIHGPIIARNGDKGLALRWVAQDMGFDMINPFLDMNVSKDCGEIREALREYPGPALNFVFADIEGNIGYQGGAKVPMRAKGDGTIPYRGETGDSEWEGYIPFDEMPQALNPDSGWIATANNMVVNESYPHLITKCWESPYRQARIADLLKAKDKLSIEDMRDIQGDVYTLTGRTYADMVISAADGKELEQALAAAVKRLKAWDGMAHADSVAMTIYFFGWRHVVDLLLRHRLGDALFEEYILSWFNLKEAILGLLDEKDPYWLPPQCRDYDELLLLSIQRAIDEIAKKYETRDDSQWTWGTVHTLTAFHLLGLFWPLNKLLNVGPVPREGEGETVNNAMPESDTMIQVFARGALGGASNLDILPDKESHATYGGPVTRFIADLSDWDNCRMSLDIGQSGHRMSPHYKDHFQKWLQVDHFSLPFSDEKIEEHAESRLFLVPAGTKPQNL